MDREEFKAVYEKKAEKHDLPKFDLLDDYFEVFDIFHSKNIPTTWMLRNIRRFISDKVWNVVNFIHNFLIPSQQSLISMEEAKMFTDAEKKEMAQLMKRLTILARKSSAIELECNADKDASYIKEVCETWTNIKPELQKIVDKNIERWETEKEEKEDKPPKEFYG